RAPVPAPAADTTAAPADPLDRVLAELRETVASQPDHPAWEVLDRARVDELLGRPAARLDAMSRAYVWRIATVFGTSWTAP
ncbi:MAG: hypothetical protein JWM71_1705, partial [Solirubrobacteraceae bacterium]|nr:hypothetical protein [Solirubrobacteraceae bacterium]